MADGTLAQRILERLGILTSTEPVEHGWEDYETHDDEEDDEQ